MDYTILIIDDDKELLESLYKYLKNKGFGKVLTAKNLVEAEFKISNSDLDLIVLDLMLPDGSGFNLLKNIRKKSKVPVIILSALDGIEDRREGFESEADDYIVKPFLPEDLLWRIEAVLRRSQGFMKEERVKLGNVIFDKQKAMLIKNDKEENLTAKQFQILDLLSNNLNKIVSINQILDDVWGETYGYENTLIAHIYRIREKLEEDPKNPKILVTIKGLGYKLVASEDF